MCEGVNVDVLLPFAVFAFGCEKVGACQLQLHC